MKPVLFAIGVDTDGYRWADLPPVLQRKKNMATKAALEIEVELDDGRLMVVVQEKDDEYAVGDRIRLIQSPDGSVRIRQ